MTISFDDFGFNENLLKAIHERGYSTPTPIQAEAIPHALQGKDVLGIAQTGTGKTASFTLPLIERMSRGRAKARMPRSIIVAPTRELAAQVAENFEAYAKYSKLTLALLIGGVSFGDQERLLNQGVDVLIATPGRLLDQFDRGKILMTGVQVLVIDEADRMLDMGFIEDIERIFKMTPFTRQTLFFSATMPPEIQRLTDQFLHNPVRIEVARQSTTAELIEQFQVRVGDDSARSKRIALRATMDHAKPKSAIIFCNRKRDVDIVARSLERYGYSAAAIHGDLAQSVRTATLDRFKSGDVQFLIASDVAARGLDISDVAAVFNYDLPRHPEDYVHRIGRTGRAGRTGVAYSLVTPEDTKALKAVEDMIAKSLPKAAIEIASGAGDDEADEGNRGRSASRNRGGSRSRSRSTARTDQPDEPAAVLPEGETNRNETEGPSRPARSRNRVVALDRSDHRNGNRDTGGRHANTRRDRSDQDDNRPTVGFGDDTPAFLMVE
jgi:superfamily II DNA/RNA helicase